MSADLSSGQSSGRSAGLTLNLSSNNPFRNRAASPSNGPSPSFSPPPHSPFDDPLPARPVSRNPFFDPSDKSQVQRVKSMENMSATQNRKSPTAEELFDNMVLDDKKGTGKPLPRPDGARGPPRGPPGGPPRGENMPPPGGRGPPPSHRPTRSQEEALRARRTQDRNNGSVSGEKNIFDSPQKRAERRARRNSESSAMDAEKPLTEEEKKQRELRRRERERRHRERKDKDKTGRPSKRLDLIDQLDATSIYGTGLFHHDGPFDALNPHRNRKGSSRAPMQAFPKDSLNNTIGGSGPLNTRPDHATFLGKHDEEAFTDYNVSGKDAPGFQEPLMKKSEAAVFDPLKRGSILHGDETMGLGTSTFLEGTPAARTAIQRRQAETAQTTAEQGLGRKQSLAQRIRGGINRGPRDPNGPRTGDLPTSSSTGERNPFFNEYDTKNEERISVKRQDGGPVSPMSPNSPPRGYTLERRSTTDANAVKSPDAAKPQGGGLLARVKSLKGGRKARPPQPPTPGYGPPAPSSGTAI